MRIAIDANLFRDCMKSVSALVDEIRVLFTKAEMKVIAMDPANISMVVLTIPSTAAIEWQTEVSEGQEAEEVCFRLKELNAILKKTAKEDILKLNTDNNRLNIEISGYKKFSVPLIEPEDGKKAKEQKMPELSPKVTIKLPVKKFLDAIEDCSIAADSIQFKADAKSWVLSAEGDMTKAAITLDGQDVAVNGEFSKEKSSYKGKYSVEYLNKIVVKVAETMTVAWSDDYPVTLQYKTATFNLVFILAPRVEND
jgi:DNA polymerase III sliding clamp (beta) subunit (PCNA family)